MPTRYAYQFRRPTLYRRRRIPMKRSRLNANSSIGNSPSRIATVALIISISALIVSIWQATQQRGHNRLSVRPALRLDKDSGEDGTLLGIELRNAGTGPALITRFALSVDGVPVKPTEPDDIWDAAEKVLDITRPSLHLAEYYYDRDDAIPPNEDRYLIGMTREVYEKLSEEDKQLWKRTLPRITVEIEYNSVYGEAFKVQFPRTTSSR